MDSPVRDAHDKSDNKDRSSTRHHHKSSRDHSRDRDRSRDRQPRRKRSRSPRSPGSRRDRSRDRRRDGRDHGDSHRNRDDRRRRSRDRHADGDKDGYRSDRKSQHRSDRHSERDRDRDSRRRDNDNREPAAVVKRSGPLPSQADSFALTTTGEGEEPPKPKEKANFGTSGALAAASNAVAQADGTQIVLKYHEPPEARKPAPKDVWKLFVFKGDEIIDTVPLSQRSCWLVGRESAVVDMIAEHPSISKQHAVIQFRYLEKRNEFGDKIGKVKPYLIDLDSANGTLLNSKKVPESRYLELIDKDLIQFGQSTREYVIMLAPKD